ncbi:16094_t:CDS:2, partial [Cetraspora pellucida]
FQVDERLRRESGRRNTSCIDRGKEMHRRKDIYDTGKVVEKVTTSYIVKGGRRNEAKFVDNEKLR